MTYDAIVVTNLSEKSIQKQCLEIGIDLDKERMAMLYQFESLKEFIEKIKSYKYVYLFGAGCSGKLVGEYLNKQRIDWRGYLDNNKKLYETLLNGKEIRNPSEVIDKNNSLIIICTRMASKEIEEQLLVLGFHNKNIYQLTDRSLFYSISVYNHDLQPYLKRLEKLRKEKPKELSRCFIIGTGPSLRIKDLEQLSDEYTMATNSIVKCFSQTSWRPNCYFVEDPAAVNYDVLPYGVGKLLKECKNVICSSRCDLYKYAEQYENLFFHYVAESRTEQLPKFSSDPRKVVYEYGTTLYTMLQMAVYIGFTQIYLLGVDLGFVRERHLDGSVEVHAKEKDRAEFLSSSNEPIAIYETEKIIDAYKAAKKYADSHEIKIYNATRGGQLEVFERVEFDSLF